MALFVILRSAVLVQCRLVTKTHTDGQTYDVSIYRTSIALQDNIACKQGTPIRCIRCGDVYVCLSVILEHFIDPAVCGGGTFCTINIKCGYILPDVLAKYTSFQAVRILIKILVPVVDLVEINIGSITLVS